MTVTHEGPQTDKALYRLIQKLFGIGNWNRAKEEYWVYEVKEIGKMKHWRCKRNLSLWDLWVAAKYAKTRGLVITTPFDLTYHVAAAKRWIADANEATKKAQVQDRIDAALVRERTLSRPEADWAGQLMRAQGDAREEVLSLWESSLL